MELFVHCTLLGVWLGPPLRLHHLVDLAPLLAVLGEGLAVVGSQLDSPLSTVIGYLDCSDKLSELNIVRAGVPLSWVGGRASQSTDNFRMLNSSQKSEVTRSHSSVVSLLSQLGKGWKSQMCLLWF